MVHLIVVVPLVKPVIVLVGDDGVVIVTPLHPETQVQAPVAGETGVFPANVAVVTQEAKV
jgi:hypothetical protein